MSPLNVSAISYRRPPAIDNRQSAIHHLPQLAERVEATKDIAGVLYRQRGTAALATLHQLVGDLVAMAVLHVRLAGAF